MGDDDNHSNGNGRSVNPSLDAAVAQLNQLLNANGITPYKLAVVDPREVVLLEKNAHYMTKRVFDQLVHNIKQDGNLESLPFCWQREDGKFVALSGNHRVQAAREAAVPQILILYTDDTLLKDAQVAKQLAHNALVGMDNPVLLAELYKGIGELGFKVYSGLDDGTLQTLEKVEIHTPREAGLLFEEVILLFVPSEIDKIEKVVAQLKHHKRATLLAAKYADWERFFETLLKFKEDQKIVNSATAVRVMCEIVEEWLKANNTEAE